MSNQKRIDQLKLEMQVAVDEFNKIQEKIQELTVAKQSLKMKAYSCSERIKELQGQKEIEKTSEIVN
jgi:predicted  nucleic acid-binding Zn-ribbon protein